jgi:hypothetical protein
MRGRTWLLAIAALVALVVVAGAASAPKPPELLAGDIEWGPSTVESFSSLAVFATRPSGPCLPGECVSACSDAYDNDGDGLVDYGQDPGCYGPQDNDEYNAPPAPPPPPTPPPPPPPSPTPPPPPPAGPPTPSDMAAGLTVWTASSEQDCFTGLQLKDPVLCYATDDQARCKYQTFDQPYDEAIAGVRVRQDVLVYRGWFRVCYVPGGGGILSVQGRGGDAVSTKYPFSWQGNASGYPQHQRFAHYVDFLYRGKMGYCVIDWGCVKTYWPYVTVRFTDNNTKQVIALGTA